MLPPRVELLRRGGGAGGRQGRRAGRDGDGTCRMWYTIVHRCSILAAPTFGPTLIRAKLDPDAGYQHRAGLIGTLRDSWGSKGYVRAVEALVQSVSELVPSN